MLRATICASVWEDSQGKHAKVTFHHSVRWEQLLFQINFLFDLDNPKAVGFAAIVGGGAVGYLLLILIAVVLIAIIVWIGRQLKREKGIAAAGECANRMM